MCLSFQSQLGYYGPSYSSLYCVTHIETLQLWDVPEARLLQCILWALTLYLNTSYCNTKQGISRDCWYSFTSSPSTRNYDSLPSWITGKYDKKLWLHQQKKKKAKKIELEAKQLLCRCITLFGKFLSRPCMTTKFFKSSLENAKRKTIHFTISYNIYLSLDAVPFLQFQPNFLTFNSQVSWNNC